MQTYVQVNWNAIAAISSATYTSLFLISIFIIWEQLRGLRRALYAQSFSDALDRLQNDSVRAARAQLFALREKSVDTWTKEEERAAETVCQTYDSVGIMVRNSLLPKVVIVDSWGDSLRRLWPIVEPLVKKYRQERNSPEFWDDFEWLYGEAMAQERRRQKSRH